MHAGEAMETEDKIRSPHQVCNLLLFHWLRNSIKSSGGSRSAFGTMRASTTAGRQAEPWALRRNDFAASIEGSPVSVTQTAIAIHCEAPLGIVIHFRVNLRFPAKSFLDL